MTAKLSQPQSAGIIKVHVAISERDTIVESSISLRDKIVHYNA